MKNFFKDKVVKILSWESKRILDKHLPFIISITGNVGKTTTKDYVYSLLRYKYGQNVRASEKSQNSEFGLNLTIIGEKNAWNSPIDWLKVLWSGLVKVYTLKKYPEVLVLEVGADKPGDIRLLSKIFKSNLVVLTAFQEAPTHGEFFLNIDQHINEKKVLVETMEKDGAIVFNADDQVMSKMARESKEKSNNIQIFSFGYATDSNVQILDCNNLYDDQAELIGSKIKFRINLQSEAFKVMYDLDLRFLSVTGNAHAYSIASAICVALLHGFTKEDILESVQDIEFSKSRMRVLNGINGTKIIDDCYNASPIAMQNAIETLFKILAKGKKVAILGHMAELGNKTKDEHFKTAILASKVFDVVILSGRYNEYYLEGLKAGKFDLAKVFLASNAKEVLNLIVENNLLRNLDIVLVKGSQSARLEKVVTELLAYRNDVDKVCRQDDEWKNR